MLKMPFLLHSVAVRGLPAGDLASPTDTGRLLGRRGKPIQRMPRPIAGARGDFQSSRRCLGTTDSELVLPMILLPAGVGAAGHSPGARFICS